MMLYSKNGSIPKPETDGTEGWLEVPNPPDVPEGKELVWLNWEWVVRSPKPADNPGMQWNWNHAEMDWVESAYGVSDVVEQLIIEMASAEPVIEGYSADISLGSADVSFGSAGPV